MCWGLLLSAVLGAEPDTTADTVRIRAVLPELVISAPRWPVERWGAPAAVYAVEVRQRGQAGALRSLGELLEGLPGLMAFNFFNAAQDVRLAVRGLGARAAFGIRGLQVWVDGLPLTLPDGQTAIEHVDPAEVRRLELLRGPAAALYGNASGGVLALETAPRDSDPSVELDASWGAYGWRRLGMRAWTKGPGMRLGASAAYGRSKGHRAGSAWERYLVSAWTEVQSGPRHRWTLRVGLLDTPWAGDPGGLSRAQAAADPWGGDLSAVRFRTGESVGQLMGSARYTGLWGDHGVFEAGTYALGRSFFNRLPFSTGGIVLLQRWVWGGYARYRWERLGRGDRGRRLLLGLDLSRQRDERRRFDNRSTDELGPLRLDQREEAATFGLYGLFEGRWGPWTLQVGLRRDEHPFRIRDRWLSDGDDSGRRCFRAWSATAALGRRLAGRLYAHARLGTGFDTPTFTELANPTGGGGMNAELRPQRALGGDVGLKGSWDSVLSLEVIGFYVSLWDELVPFERPEFPGRRFFRNAGRSERRGLEAAFRVGLPGGWAISAAITELEARFRRYGLAGADLRGRSVPGLPRRELYGALYRVAQDGLTVRLFVRHTGVQYADEANLERVPAQTLVGMVWGARWRVGSFRINPFGEVHNLFDVAHYANVRPNAAGGRYYEPGPGRHLVVGLRLEG
ncbi:MAG: TonB-dependent receptor [Bacteroidetes bacterium]|nr:TonB-dependent receptor [Rhodothermia bacterium]MCS7156020.1 TonB-dependent receptor [Bacteroidota bacterium]MCX7907708.1 TonB-dependent receptor [Bacteroidota bacterium]MDW8286312.1 TonB-dependent receptor [Bacteroidota bacterium]